ncbi:MAG: hypothetical protein JW737_07520 [Acidobacteria bacterium]|nr:hypothetical protein [Acidobacteriota bacterium]
MKKTIIFLLFIMFSASGLYLKAETNEGNQKHWGIQMFMGGTNFNSAKAYLGLGINFQLNRFLDINFNYRALADVHENGGWNCYYVTDEYGTYEVCDEGTSKIDIEESVLEISAKLYLLRFDDIRVFVLGGPHTNFDTLEPLIGGGIDWILGDQISLYGEYCLALRAAEKNLQYIGIGLKLTPWVFNL